MNKHERALFMGIITDRHILFNLLEGINGETNQEQLEAYWYDMEHTFNHFSDLVETLEIKNRNKMLADIGKGKTPSKH